MRDRESWKRIFKKGIIVREGNIFIITPIVPFPFLSLSLLLQINIFWLNKFQVYVVNYLKKRLQIKEVVLWINHPYFSATLVNQIQNKLFCYDLCDDYNAKEKDKTSIVARLIKKNDDYLTKSADIMSVSSKKLFQDRCSRNSNILRVPNGVDLGFFKETNFLNNEPTDLKHVPRPRLIYVGNISPSIDLELLQWIDRNHPEWSIVMIGPVHGKMFTKELKKIKSVYLIGVKPYEETIAYIELSDVAVIPYLKSSWAIAGDSIKIYNFLASGKPVVSTEIGGVENFSDAIFVGKDHKGFVKMIELALNETRENCEHRKKIQYEIVKEHTWRKRAEDIYNRMMTQLQSQK
ncbi:MAG: glycosyltransferase [Thermodesulfobacteriota bacterium]